MAAPVGKRETPVGPELLAFVDGLFAREDDALRAIREETPEKGLPAIAIRANEGKILDLLARAVGARRVVEVGTLAGYSGTWLARALPADGVLHTIEFDPKHAAVARENFKRAGVAGKTRVHEGAGLDVLPRLAKEGPFDLCFIDADKPNYVHYGRWAAENVRPGGLVIGDNSYLFGKVHLRSKDAGEWGPAVDGMRGFLELLADRTLFSSCAMIPTPDGLAVGVRR